MKKYQKEGKYEALTANMSSVHEVAIIKIAPKEIRGKYKIGQHWAPAYRLRIAKNIIEREGESQAESILHTMGIEIQGRGELKIVEEPVM
jgi:uncharacterized protein